MVAVPSSKLAVVLTFLFLYIVIVASTHKEIIEAGGAVALVGLIAIAGSLFLLLYITPIAVEIYVICKPITRRNDHFRRTHKLYDTIINLLKEKNG